MKKDESIRRYELAATVLPARLRKAALELPDEMKAVAEEFRLRVGRALSILLPEGEFLLESVIEQEDLDVLCDLATEFSRYAAAETIREGFIPVKGGFRIGMCGTAVMKNGVNTTLKNLSSAAVRIGRERKGIAEKVLPELLSCGRWVNTLILSPPGGGKTTFLRDLVRLLSTENRRVSLIDERGEIAVMYRGKAQLDVGPCTDVLDACPKAIGIPMVLRAMNPQIIAVDEVTVQEDIQAISLAVGCGVGILATTHAGSVEELRRKPVHQRLLESGVFQKAVCITHHEAGRTYSIEEL